jgi:hypothetical protein
MKILFNLSKYFGKKHPKTHLGRWNIENCNKTVNSKIDLSNEDHCGPCGQYAMTKNASTQQTNLPIDLIHYIEKK